MFDTLKYSKKLESIGFTSKQAEGQAQALLEVLGNNLSYLVTKQDLRDELSPIKLDIAISKNDIVNIKYYLGILGTGIIMIIAGILVLIIKTYT